MELKNDFVVDRPVSETWKILTNLELIAPCLPGARLEEVEGDEYRGSVAVKVGPITGKYKGKASFLEQDEANRVARLRAEGRDPRQGNANALITAAMSPAGPDGTQTRVDLTTDLGLSGKIASFARGNLEDVSRKLLNQFATNLEAMLAEQGDTSPASTLSATSTAAPSGTPAAESAAPTPGVSEGAVGGAAVPGDVVAAPDAATAASATVDDAAATTAAGGTTAGTTATPATTPGTITDPGGSDSAPTPPPVEQATSVPPRPTVRKIDAPEAKPVDLLAVAGADTMAKRLAPVMGAVVLLLLVRWLLRRRH